jgi:hypothetical protein
MLANHLFHSSLFTILHYSITASSRFGIRFP